MWLFLGIAIISLIVGLKTKRNLREFYAYLMCISLFGVLTSWIIFIETPNQNVEYVFEEKVIALDDIIYIKEEVGFSEKYLVIKFSENSKVVKVECIPDGNVKPDAQRILLKYTKQNREEKEGPLIWFGITFNHKEVVRIYARQIL